VIRAAAGDRAVPGPPHDLTPAPGDPPWVGWCEVPSVGGFTARWYPIVDGQVTEPRLARLARPAAAAGPAPIRSHRRLHLVATRLATDPASDAVRDALPILRPPTA
jgi:hypothetical protein